MRWNTGNESIYNLYGRERLIFSSHKRFFQITTKNKLGSQVNI